MLLDRMMSSSTSSRVIILSFLRSEARLWCMYLNKGKHVNR
eukprot:CAMPEP_0114266278 /NCGR_PEP_ID=MMETSP0058-20121206/24520_1 /TAXON_ID=36894 /ORGANISM="Pyramimonas parkeae, CCMP726" /LENGTH=40 /DNA_ID= /DNA_START= /DNA_END= /DNA_ORIENTATION=